MEPDFIQLFIEPLEELGVQYMITGGVASVIYGDPRFTRDIDVVLELHASNVQRLRSAFSTDDFYVPPVETMLEEAARSRFGHFNLIHNDSALRADVYLLGDDPLHAWAFGRRRRLAVGSTSIWIAPIEYVILRKLEYFQSSGSERHLRDVAMMLRISSDSVNLGELESWIERLGLQQAMDTARSDPKLLD